MKQETWEKYKAGMDEIINIVEGTVTELKAADAAGGGLGGAAFFAAKLKKQVEELQEFIEKQKQEIEE